MFIALWTKIFFRKTGFNYYEILILLCYIMGMGMLIFSFFAILQRLIKLKIMQLASMTGIVYCNWAIALFFWKEEIDQLYKSNSILFFGINFIYTYYNSRWFII
jgi:hypothetical protein